jgi:outer membrane protein assembly factor BamB
MLRAYPTTGGNCGGSPRACSSSWFAHVSGGATSSPVVDGDRVFMMWDTGTAWSVAAYDASGRGDCSGPPGCRPLWTGTFGTAPAAATTPVLTVADGRVYAVGQTDSASGTPASLAVFDAAGSTGCGGTPVVCQPVFRTTASVAPWAYPAVADGRLFVTGSDGVTVLVFDAKGQTGCTVAVCSPLFRLQTNAAAAVSVADGVAYVAAGGKLLAFDATGASGCSGTPLTCAPRWTSAATGSATTEPPVVLSGRVYVGEMFSTGSSVGAEAFDALGSTGCSGTPKVCAPLVRYSAPAGATIHISATKSLLLATVWNIIPGVSSEGRLAAFDAAGVQGCAGAPKTCSPLQQWSLGDANAVGGPTAAHGRIAVDVGISGQVQVFERPS